MGHGGEEVEILTDRADFEVLLENETCYESAQA